MAWDDFDTSEFDVDSFTSTHDDDDTIGLVDDDDLKFVQDHSILRKSAATVRIEELEKEDIPAINHVTVEASNKIEASTVVPTGIYKNKIEHARAIYQRFVDSGISFKRKDVVAAFIAEANCTSAGASTYYNTINTGK